MVSRLLLIDENIRDTDGHYLELAELLMDGADRLGVHPTLATNLSYVATGSEPFDVWPAFHSRRMNRWSLGVDGQSRVQRSLSGKPIGGDFLTRCWQRTCDVLCSSDRRPAKMLQQWSSDFSRLLTTWNPGPNDSVLINTADDFVMLGLASGLQQYAAKMPLQIRAIFHFAAFDGQDNRKPHDRAMQFGQQVNASLSAIRPHHVSLFATTESLANQLAAVGVTAASIPYPTRDRDLAGPIKCEEPLRILMAGMPRAEKGRDQIPLFLSAIDQPYLRSGQFRVAMQMRNDQWQRLIPKPLHADYAIAVDDDDRHVGALEIVSSNLPGQEYHRWLGSADVGLFLYDPDRYVARCSGVLLEMFIAGVPVIVPANCWLADQVQIAGGDGSVGFIYESMEQIPALLGQIKHEYTTIRSRSIQHAKTIRQHHSGENTMRMLGLSRVDNHTRRTA